MTQDELCPCGSEKLYKDCCECFLSGTKLPDTPEELMRSRYTAYTKGYIDYIFSTMRDSALKNSDREASRNWSKTSRWLGLQVLEKEMLSETDATVLFKVEFEHSNKKQILSEKSVFKKYDNKWYYVGNVAVDANQEVIKPVTVDKIGRNDPCTCGSGKKYKKCCLA